MNNSKKLQISFLIALVLIALFFTLFQLGKSPLADYDEATYAQIAQNALTHGHWMTFQYQGANWFEKPPLYLWSTILSIKAFGVSEFAVRLPSALANVLAVLFLYLLVWELSEDVWLSAFCGIALLAVQPFFIFARQSRMDVSVIAAILFAIWSFVKGSRVSQDGKLSHHRYLMGLGIGIGIGIMTKSVIGLLAIIPVVIWSVLNKNWRWVKDKYFWIGMLIMLIIVLPWHVYESIHYGLAFWQSYLFQQVIACGAQAPGDQPISALDYFKDLWYQVQPWTVIFLLLIPVAVFLKKENSSRRVAWFGFLSAIILFGFFLVAQTKIFTYLLPIFPFALIFIGATIFGISRFVIRQYRIVFLILVCGGILALAFWNTINDTFVNYPKYFAYLQDEKNIGLMLASSNGVSTTMPVFMYDWVPNTTLMFYSGRMINSIQNLQSLPASSDFLIVPTADLASMVQDKPLHRSAQIAYEGSYLSLLNLH